MSKKQTLLFIIIITVTLTVFSGCVQQNQDLEKEKKEQSKKYTDEKVEDDSNYGTIKGNINYIKPIYKDLKTCAEDITSKKKYCTEEYETVQVKKGVNQRKYELKVPKGKYKVYTTDHDGRKGYYSDFAICGLKASCDSHKIVVVDIKKGETKKNINPLDWYRD